MSADGSLSRALVTPVDASAGGVPKSITDVIADRIGNQSASIESLSVDRHILTEYRKVSPDIDTVANPAVFQPGGREYMPGFLDRIVSFFVRPGREPSGKETIRVADEKDSTKREDRVHDLNNAIDRLEDSQQFATGMTLMSSLTQSAMSSSRRLTQGQ